MFKIFLFLSATISVNMIMKINPKMVRLTLKILQQRVKIIMEAKSGDLTVKNLQKHFSTI